MGPRPRQGSVSEAQNRTKKRRSPTKSVLAIREDAIVAEVTEELIMAEEMEASAAAVAATLLPFSFLL